MPISKLETKTVTAPPADDLRRTFATALSQIQPSGKPLRRSQTPIFVRKNTTSLDGPAVEKQALTTAARALAQLWNIKPTLIH
jgi:hypothetical protein